MRYVESAWHGVDIGYYYSLVKMLLSWVSLFLVNESVPSPINGHQAHAVCWVGSSDTGVWYNSEQD